MQNCPQGLKPRMAVAFYGTAEAVPFLETWLFHCKMNGRVPHISLVFREMWDTADLGSPLLIEMPSPRRESKISSRVLWYPTSREKRARYGAPEFVAGKMPKNLVLTQALKHRSFWAVCERLKPSPNELIGRV
jgi:hypothetical protein